MKINYTIKMPVNNSLNLNNDYGAINLNKLDGKATINCDYGKLIIGELNSNDCAMRSEATRIKPWQIRLMLFELRV